MARTLLYEFARNKSLGPTANLGPTLTFTRSTTGTYINAAGTVTTAAINEARYDHPVGGGDCLGLLIEGSITNYVLQSEDFATTWTKTAGTTITTNTTAAPDGNTTADTWTPVAATDSVSEARAGVTTAGDRVTVSCWMKVASGTKLMRLGIFTNNGGNERGPDFTVTTTWQRFQYTTTWVAASTTRTVAIYNGSTETSAPVIIWGFQGEKAEYASSYIPTTTVTVTRGADVCSTTTLTWLTAATGTFLVRGRFLAGDTVIHPLLTLDDGTTTDQLQLTRSAAEAINFDTTSNTGNQGSSSGTIGMAGNTEFFIAAAYAQDNVRAAVNGTLSLADTSATLPVTDAATTLRIGSDSNSKYWDGHIHTVSYYPTRRTDSELQTLSTSGGTVPGDYSWLFDDGLETTQPFNLNFSSPGATTQQSQSVVHGGVWAMQEITPDVAPRQYKKACIVKTFTPIVYGLHVIDFWFWHSSTGDTSRATEIPIEGFNGTQQYYSGWQFMHDNVFTQFNGWRYWVPDSGDGDWGFMPGGSGKTLTPDAWYHFHGEVDWGTRQYVKAIITDTAGNADVYDLTGLPMSVSPRLVAGTSYQFTVFAWAQTAATQPVYQYVDDVRFGQIVPGDVSTQVPVEWVQAEALHGMALGRMGLATTTVRPGQAGEA